MWNRTLNWLRVEAPAQLRSLTQRAVSYAREHRTRLILVAGIVLLAAALHTYFAVRAPVDFDEPIYTTAAYRYADDIHRGDIGALLSDPFNAEHPALTKLLYAGAILTDWQLHGYVPLSSSEQYYYDGTGNTFQEGHALARYNTDARTVAWIFGVLFVLLLALYSPLAGLFAALSTVALRYTTDAYLDAPGVFFSTLAILLYLRWKERRSTWLLVVAGAALGLAFAAKYYYALAGVVILIDLIVTYRKALRPALRPALILGVAAFVVASLGDLPLWTQGLGKSAATVSSNGVYYASGASAPSSISQWFSTLITLFVGFRSWPAPFPSPFLVRLDSLIGLFAVVGVAVTWRRYSIFNVWLALVCLVLLLYPVKYQQYAALGIAPLCLVAAVGARWLFDTGINFARTRLPQLSEWRIPLASARDSKSM
jgi:Dolichyl-phosphate-mannose-protein mannosyltransferase